MEGMRDTIVQSIQAKYNSLRPVLDERARRLWAAAGSPSGPSMTGWWPRPSRMRGRVEGRGGDARADRQTGADPDECAGQFGLAIAGGQKPTASSVRPFRNASSARIPVPRELPSGVGCTGMLHPGWLPVSL
jgi:hypothetical protein